MKCDAIIVQIRRELIFTLLNKQTFLLFTPFVFLFFFCILFKIIYSKTSCNDPKNLDKVRAENSGENVFSISVFLGLAVIRNMFFRDLQTDYTKNKQWYNISSTEISFPRSYSRASLTGEFEYVAKTQAFLFWNCKYRFNDNKCPHCVLL